MDYSLTNNDAYLLLKENNSDVPNTTRSFLKINDLPECQYDSIRRKFSLLLNNRRDSVKSKELSKWDAMTFYKYNQPSKKRKSTEADNNLQIIFEEDPGKELRKPFMKLTLKQARSRLDKLLQHIYSLAEIENVSPKAIATSALQMISNDDHDQDTSKVCQRMLGGEDVKAHAIMPIDKSAFLLDFLEIGRRKYTELRKLCRTEDIVFPSYNHLASYRNEVGLLNRIAVVNKDLTPVGVSISYQEIVSHTLKRLLSMIKITDPTEYPLTLTIADGTDGSGSHRIYNQQTPSPNISTKNFLLFGFKVLSITNSDGVEKYANPSPNSPYSVRPIALLAMEETRENVFFLMENDINNASDVLSTSGFELSQGHVNVVIKRCMFDGKMSKVLSGAGGANCQLCTTSFGQLKDLHLIRDGYPINRTITAAKMIFQDDHFNESEFFSLPSDERFNLTHQPASDQDIISASPLHSYLRVFSWFMDLIAHLSIGRTNKWAPSSRPILESRKFVSSLVNEKTSLQIDLPNSHGGTSTTGNIARKCMSRECDDDKDFLYWVLSMLPSQYQGPITKIHTNLGVILRIFNSGEKIDTDSLNTLCKDTYEFIVIEFSFANITPSLHKLLAHAVDLICDYNDGYGLKKLSEEGLEACNKHIRRYREHLSRKNCFVDNIRDIFVRLLCQSDPIPLEFRNILLPNSRKCASFKISQQNTLFNSIIIKETN